MCFDKNCQVNMWPVKPEMDVQSKEPQFIFKKKHVPLCSDKNCQSTKCYRKKSPVRTRCSNAKNCQSTMWPNKPISNPAMEQSNPEDKNCQSTRCFKKKCPMRPVCNDKNCQSDNIRLDLNLKELTSYVVSTKG